MSNDYAFDIYTGEDWGGEPVDLSGYDYATPAEALAAAIGKIREAGYDWEQTGIYVTRRADEAAADRGRLYEPEQWQWNSGPLGHVLTGMAGGAQDVDVSDLNTPA